MLTPQEIENKVFKRSLRGYDVADVESFLQEVCDSYQRLYQENLAAKERIGMLSDAVRQYKAMEDTLQNAMQVAKENGEAVKRDAEEQAGAILRKAEDAAEESAERSAREVAGMAYQYEQMKRSVEVFRAKVVSLLHAQLDIIKDYSNIRIDEETLAEAKAVLDRELSEHAEHAEAPTAPEVSEVAEAPGEEQTTAVLPKLVRDEDGTYIPEET